MLEKRAIIFDDIELDVSNYIRMHERRIGMTVDLLRKYCGRRVIELGAHPWVMTSKLIDDPGFDVIATVSVEEVTLWPDDVEFSSRNHTIVTLDGRRQVVKNYSLNVERKLVSMDDAPDAVVACEILEHLIRAPHVMFLNMNSWLNQGGIIVLTTPNGSQFMNPFRRKPRMPAYRAHCYERHSYVYRLTDLIDLAELCGFEILDSGYWSPYTSTGIRRLGPLLAKLPGHYFSEKFERTLYIVARKSKSVKELSRLPNVYEPSRSWEHISNDN